MQWERGERGTARSACSGQGARWLRRAQRQRQEGVSKFDSEWKRPCTFTFTSFSLKEPKKKRLLNERRWPEMLNVEVFEVQLC
jgi:hypothetical protein